MFAFRHRLGNYQEWGAGERNTENTDLTATMSNDQNSYIFLFLVRKGKNLKLVIIVDRSHQAQTVIILDNFWWAHILFKSYLWCFCKISANSHNSIYCYIIKYICYTMIDIFVCSNNLVWSTNVYFTVDSLFCWIVMARWRLLFDYQMKENL